MNFAEIISDLKSYDSKRYYAILQKLDLTEINSIDGGDHLSNDEKHTPSTVGVS